MKLKTANQQRKINEAKRQFFEKINENDKTVARLTMKKMGKDQ